MKKGDEIFKIYRGNGITLVVTEDNVFRTLLESGSGLDLGIRMIE